MNDIETLVTWLRVFVWVAAIGATAFPILYAFSPWYKSALGRILMLQAVSFALALDITLLGFYGYPKNVVTAIWVSFVIFGLIALSTISLTFLLWRTNHVNPLRLHRKDKSNGAV